MEKQLSPKRNAQNEGSCCRKETLGKPVLSGSRFLQRSFLYFSGSFCKHFSSAFPGNGHRSSGIGFHPLIYPKAKRPAFA